MNKTYFTVSTHLKNTASSEKKETLNFATFYQDTLTAYFVTKKIHKICIPHNRKMNNLITINNYA